MSHVPTTMATQKSKSKKTPLHPPLSLNEPRAASGVGSCIFPPCTSLGAQCVLQDSWRSFLPKVSWDNGGVSGLPAAGGDPAHPSFVILAVNKTVKQRPNWLNAGLKGKRKKTGGCLMIKQLFFFFMAKHWSCFILMHKSVHRQVANCLRVETEPHRTVALGGGSGGNGCDDFKNSNLSTSLGGLGSTSPLASQELIL